MLSKKRVDRDKSIFGTKQSMFEAYRFFFYCGASLKAKSLSFIFLVEAFSNSCVVPIPKLKGIISLAHSVLLLILPFIREL